MWIFTLIGIVVTVVFILGFIGYLYDEYIENSDLKSQIRYLTAINEQLERQLEELKK